MGIERSGSVRFVVFVTSLLEVRLVDWVSLKGAEDEEELVVLFD